MGCLVFILTVILSWIFYMFIGGFVVDYYMQLKGIKGLDAHTVVMTYAFKTVPLLTFFTAFAITLFFVIKDQLKSTDKQPTSKEYEEEW